MDLDGKLLLVTGGGSGLGEGCCFLAAKRNAKVIIADLDLASAQRTLNQIGDTTLKNAECHSAFQVDVSDSESVSSLAEKVLEKYGGRAPDMVIHSAGIALNLDGIEGSTEDLWNKVIGVNLTGTYLINRKFCLLMKKQAIKGSIVNMSSINAKGLWNSVGYAASKGGVESLTKSLGKEMGPWGIRVNAVAPGSIDTPMSRKSDGANASMVPAVPLENRKGKAKEVAEVCLFLASDASSYVTASVYDVHGGFDINPGRLSK